MADRCSALPYFPFDDDVYRMAMGTRALGSAPLIEVDVARYRAELALKDAILAADERYYCQALPGTEPLHWEAVTYLLPLMARQHPAHFALHIDGDRWRWTNHLLGTAVSFAPGDPSGLPRPPLDWLGRQVQEDLLLMDGRTEGAPLVAGHLCFAAGWCLDDKLGRSFLDIHEPVPGFAGQIGRSADLLMARLKPDHPVVRVNWSIVPTDQLNLAPVTYPVWRHRRQGITPAQAGARLYLRLERQTLSRLPATRAILFTIHTYRARIAAVAADPTRRRRLLNVLRTVPPAMLAYKELMPFIEPLCAYLTSEPSESPR